MLSFIYQDADNEISYYNDIKLLRVILESEDIIDNSKLEEILKSDIDYEEYVQHYGNLGNNKICKNSKKSKIQISPKINTDSVKLLEKILEEKIGFFVKISIYDKFDIFKFNASNCKFDVYKFETSSKNPLDDIYELKDYNYLFLMYPPQPFSIGGELEIKIGYHSKLNNKSYNTYFTSFFSEWHYVLFPIKLWYRFIPIIMGSQYLFKGYAKIENVKDIKTIYKDTSYFTKDLDEIYCGKTNNSSDASSTYKITIKH